MEASAIRVRAGVHRRRVAIAAPLLRLRSDQQLVAQFQAGNEDAFQVIHDRYRARLLAYVRQMLPGADPDAEDTLQDVFVRAYAGLQVADRELSLRPWLYRIAHNRCVDAVRRPVLAVAEPLELDHASSDDPVATSEQRESLRRLVIDIGRLPEQQRSALLMRELGGVAYADIAGALGVSVPAVKSLLVRARMGLAASLEARDTACSEIREELAGAHERGVRPSGIARRHLRDCGGCQEYRTELRSVSKQFAALAPAIGPLGVVAKLLGVGGGGGAAASGGAAAAGGTAGAGGSILGLATSHVAALVAATVVTAGGAVELQQTVAHLTAGGRHHAAKVTRRHTYSGTAQDQDPGPVGPPRVAKPASAGTAAAAVSQAPAVAPPASAALPSSSPGALAKQPPRHAAVRHIPPSTTGTSSASSGTSAPQSASSTSPPCVSGVKSLVNSTVAGSQTSTSSTASSTAGSSTAAGSTATGSTTGTSAATGSAPGSSTAGGSTTSSPGTPAGSTTASLSCTSPSNVLGAVVPGSATSGSGSPTASGQVTPNSSTADRQPGSTSSDSGAGKTTQS